MFNRVSNCSPSKSMLSGWRMAKARGLPSLSVKFPPASRFKKNSGQEEAPESTEGGTRVSPGYGIPDHTLEIYLFFIGFFSFNCQDNNIIYNLFRDVLSGIRGELYFPGYKKRSLRQFGAGLLMSERFLVGPGVIISGRHRNSRRRCRREEE